MGWASIDNGSPGDDVWLDRSFDGRRSWGSGSRLGNTAIPAGLRGWRTLMFNVDDWNNYGVGAPRACGKAGDRPDIACTPWARTTWSAGDRRTAAATAQMEFYNYSTGLFDTTDWWNSANALTAVIDNIRVTGCKLNAALSDHPYAGYLQRQADRAYSANRNAPRPVWTLQVRPSGQRGRGATASALDLMHPAPQDGCYEQQDDLALLSTVTGGSRSRCVAGGNYPG